MRIIVLLAALAVSTACGTEPEPPLTAHDLAAYPSPTMKSLDPPDDLVTLVPGQWRHEMPEVEQALIDTVTASFLDPRVWSAASEHEAATVVLSPLSRYLERDDLTDVALDGLRESAPHGAKVVTEIASVFPTDAQPMSKPTIYRSTWAVTNRNNDARVTVVVFAGYDVSTKPNRSPVVIGREFSIRLAPGGPNTTSIHAAIGGVVWLARGCDVVVDGVFRATDRLPDHAVSMLREEFADDSPADPMAALKSVAEASGLDILTESDERQCLAEAGGE